jgi:hypothetical protein
VNTSHTRVTTFTYDTAAHLNVQSITQTGTDGTTVTKSFTYDTLGRKQTDTLNRRTSPTNATLIPLTTSVDYDALDRTIHVTDALGCGFRPKPATHSGPCRSTIPAHAGPGDMKRVTRATLISFPLGRGSDGAAEVTHAEDSRGFTP